MQFSEIRNSSNLKFNDISSEEWREYVFSDALIVRINGPLGINISKSGGHRLVDSDGTSHYIPRGWKHLRWNVKEGEPHFVM